MGKLCSDKFSHFLLIPQEGNMSSILHLQAEDLKVFVVKNLSLQVNSFCWFVEQERNFPNRVGLRRCQNFFPDIGQRTAFLSTIFLDNPLYITSELHKVQRLSLKERFFSKLLTHKFDSNEHNFPQGSHQKKFNAGGWRFKTYTFGEIQKSPILWNILH